MNRKHTADDYRRLIDRLRTARADLVMSGDFIVGFPGETDRDFDDTLNIIRDIGYGQAYSFKYSIRPGTPAAKLPGQVPEDIKIARLEILQTLLFEQQLALNKQSLGTTVPVLFDRRGRQSGQLLGKTPFMQSVHINAPDRLFGQIVDVHIDTAKINSLSGQVAIIEPEKMEACA